MKPILSTTNEGFVKHSISIENFEKFIEIIKNREAKNEIFDEKELTSLRTEMDDEKIISLKTKLERVQYEHKNSADLLLNFIKNRFKEVNANILKLNEQPKSE